MVYLCLDSGSGKLSFFLYRDQQYLGGTEYPCLHQQSEYFFEILDRLLVEVGIVHEDIQALVVAEGPGSYTGVRLALTFAKVLKTLRPSLQLYTLNSNHLYLGTDQEGVSIIDAKSQMLYVGYYRREEFINELIPVAEFVGNFSHYYHDAHLVGKEAQVSDLAKHFWQLRSAWQYHEDANTAMPRYLKSL